MVEDNGTIGNCLFFSQSHRGRVHVSDEIAELQQKTSSQSNVGRKGQDSHWQSAVPNMMGTRPLIDTRSLGTVTTMNMILMLHLRQLIVVFAIFGGHCGSCTSSCWGVTRHTLRDCDQTLQGCMYLLYLF